MMICDDKSHHDFDGFEAHFDFDDAEVFDDAQTSF